MERLYEMVFRRVGQWVIEGEEPALQLDVLQDRQNVLYACVTGGTFK